MTQPQPIQRAVLEQAFDAASPVRDGNADLQLAQLRTPTRLYIIYPAWTGCGGLTGPHNFSNLRAADNLPGVTVQYAPLQSTPIVPTPPGQRVTNNINDSMRLLTRYGLHLNDTRAALVDGNGNLIGHVQTNTRDFISTVRRHAGLPQASAQRNDEPSRAA